MSTSLVIAIGADVDKIMERYYEPQGPAAVEGYREFVDYETEWRQEYETDTRERIRCPNGEIVTGWEERFKIGINNDGTFFELPKDWNNGYTYKVPDDHVKFQMSLKEIYKTFEEFVEAEHRGRDEETGKYGHWENPNGKFYEYAEGSEFGEWGQWFLLKDGTWTGKALKKDIDFEGTFKAVYDKAMTTYKKFRDIVAGREIPDFEEIKEKHNGDRDKAWNEYRHTPVIQDLQNCPEFEWSGWSEFNRDEETFKKVISRSHNACAVATKDTWYKEDPQWFQEGFDPTDDTWHKQVLRLFEEADDNDTIATFGCRGC